MKKTEKLVADVAKSFFPKLKDKKGRDVIEIIQAMPKNELEELEMFQFIEFMKAHIVAIIFAYAAKDEGVAYELTGRVFNAFKGIGGVNKRYRRHIEEVAKDYKKKFRGFMGYKGKPEDRVEGLLNIARGINKEMEEDREERKKKRTKKGELS